MQSTGCNAAGQGCLVEPKENANISGGRRNVHIFVASHPTVNLHSLLRDSLEQECEEKSKGFVRILSGAERTLRLITLDDIVASHLDNLTQLAGVNNITVKLDQVSRPSYGFIVEVPTEFGKRQLLDMLESQGGLSVRKEKIPPDCLTHSVVITFQSELPPQFVYLAGEEYKVYQFMDRRPKQCRQCLLFGHESGTCRNQMRCPRCSQHQYGPCMKKPRCYNCGASHSAFDMDCPFVEAAKDARDICNFEDILYKRALTKAYSIHNLTPPEVPKLTNDQPVMYCRSPNLKIPELSKLAASPKTAHCCKRNLKTPEFLKLTKGQRVAHGCIPSFKHPRILKLTGSQMVANDCSCNLTQKIIETREVQTVNRCQQMNGCAHNTRLKTLPVSIQIPTLAHF